MKKFSAALSDDLNTPRALAVLWETVQDTKMPPEGKLALLLSYDEVLGLGLKNVKRSAPVPASVRRLAAERELYRRNKQFDKADALRANIDALGYTVDDTSEGPVITPYASREKDKSSSARS
jgi:cysteinyl-tRNA synthetase